MTIMISSESIPALLELVAAPFVYGMVVFMDTRLCCCNGSEKLHRPVLDSHRYPDSIPGSGQQMAGQGLFKRSNHTITAAQRHFGIIHVVRGQYYHVELVYVL